MKYIIILSILLLTACSSQSNRCNRSNGFQQCNDNHLLMVGVNR